MQQLNLLKMQIQTEMPVDLQIAVDPVPDVSTDNLDIAVSALRAVTGDDRLAGEVCLRICDEDESRSLNASYRNRNEATNVLSFAADEAIRTEVGLLGDLAVCWPVLVYEAGAQGKALGDHFTHLFVHGVLHLLGYEHDTSDDATRMENLEVQTLAQLGISNPYAPCQ
jgi:probable rRNA maturation factor